MFDEPDFPYSSSFTPSPDPELESLFSSDPVVQPRLSVCPFSAGLPGTPAPPPVISAAPHVAPVPSVVSRVAPVPPPAPARYAQLVQVYRRHSLPAPAPT